MALLPMRIKLSDGWPVRFFIALEIEAPLRQHLIELTAGVRSSFPEVTWLSAEQLFLVMTFLGNPDRRSRKQLQRLITQIGSQVAPFEMALSTLGCFPKSDPVRTLWVGISELTGMLDRFESECDRECRKLGLLAEVTRSEFVPHIVLGRVSGKTPMGPLRRKFCDLPLTKLTQSCNQLVLVSSKLSKSGAQYEIIQRAPFSAQIAR